MSEPTKKPGVMFWTTVVVVVTLLYPISFGPACWLSSHTNIGVLIVDVAYHPLLLIWLHSPRPIGKSFVWYSNLGAADGWMWTSTGHWQNADLRFSGTR
jgi:hypothetical protein